MRSTPTLCIRVLVVVVVIIFVGVVVHAQTYTVLYNYGTNTADPLSPTPLGIGAQGRDGLFYSTTALGGAHSYGTAFKVTTGGTLTKLTDFAYPSPGAAPSGGLTLGLDGNLWGTTTAGGTSLGGTIFKISSSGALTIVWNFTGGTDEGVPYSTPVLGADGNYYGVNQGVYAGTYGAAYRMPPTGMPTTIHSFTFTDGSGPWAITLGNDGNFYGLTKGGGSSSMGVAFKMTTAGKVTVLHNFAGYPGDGNLPEGVLTQANDGNFYGVTYFGGTANLGMIFKVTPSGQTSVVYNFCAVAGCTDGKNPLTGMVLGTDGNLYGTAQGGTHGAGVIYKLTTSGTYTVLYNLCTLSGCADGFFPQTPLMQHTNGKFYGSMESGGSKAGGVFYSFDMGLGPFVRLVNWSGKVAKNVEILGQGFTGTTKVSFNGVAASFTVVSDTYLTAVVPSGATTGFVNVTTPGATLKSDRKFLVVSALLSFSPSRGTVGTPVTITGTSFTGTTKVTFGNVKATTFSVDSDTQITATVPTGAVTGKIQVTTPGGTATSATNFTVTP